MGPLDIKGTKGPARLDEGLLVVCCSPSYTVFLNAEPMSS